MCIRVLRTVALALLLATAGAQNSPTAPAPSSSPTGTEKPAPDLGDPATAERVKQEFLHAWNGYKQYAWGHDDLQPLSNTPHDWYSSSLLMTPVDALDTMLVMGLNKEADEARNLIATRLSFDHDMAVQLFEINIRLLGGLLSSYQMTNDKRLLDLADDLGTRLLPAFDSPTGMPYRYVNLKTGKTDDPNNDPAEIGTLMLEFGTLSKLTGKPIYYEKAKRAITEVYKRRSAIGLVGTVINVQTGQWVDKTSHIGARIDSYYEYLLKCSRLFGDQDFADMWHESVNAINRYVADQTRTGFWYGQVDMNTGKRIGRGYSSLDAFFPAVLALDGDLDRAQRFQDSAYKVWTTFGIEPEGIDYDKMKITADGYNLRPEIIESTYYLYFYTGDARYRTMGSTYLQSLLRDCRTPSGYAALKRVRPPQQADSMQSYFFAETLKYLYLLFAPRQTLDLDKVVFNTEAHPLRRTW
jgi:mannosidase alpha-like ER degradation enhancer 2